MNKLLAMIDCDGADCTGQFLWRFTTIELASARSDLERLREIVREHAADVGWSYSVTPSVSLDLCPRCAPVRP